MAENVPLDADDDLDLEEILEVLVDTRIARMHTSMPGVVQSYADGFATVQPAFKATTRDGRSFNLPPIVNVPVLFTAGGGYEITHPLNQGDPCILLFSERALDEWVATGRQKIAPASKRRYALADAVCIPGLRPKNNPYKTPQDGALVVGYGDNTGGLALRLVVEQGAGVSLGNDQVDVVALLDEFMGIVAGATTSNGLPLNPATIALITTLRAQLATIKRG